MVFRNIKVVVTGGEWQKINQAKETIAKRTHGGKINWHDFLLFLVEGVK